VSYSYRKWIYRVIIFYPKTLTLSVPTIALRRRDETLPQLTEKSANSLYIKKENMSINNIIGIFANIKSNMFFIS